MTMKQISDLVDVIHQETLLFIWTFWRCVRKKKENQIISEARGEPTTRNNLKKKHLQIEAKQTLMQIKI